MNTSARIASALDPTRLFTAAGIGRPDPWQRSVLLEPWQRLLMLVTRQGGKSTTIAATAAHEAIYNPESLTLITAPAQRQAKETLSKFWRFYQALGRPVRVDAKSELRVRFENGSRVIALPGTEKTIRGYSGVDLLILDEAARIEDELYYSVRPMLAVSGGRLAALTTPWGKRGFFYEAWTSSETAAAETSAEDWKRVRVTWKDCPRISEAFIQEERRSMGDWWVRQEYACHFVDQASQLFATEDIDRAFRDDVPGLFREGNPSEDAGEHPSGLQLRDDIPSLSLSEPDAP